MDDTIRPTEEQSLPLPYCPLGCSLRSLQESKPSYPSHPLFSTAAFHALMAYRNKFPRLFERIRDSDSSSSLERLGCDETLVREASRYVSELPHHQERFMSQTSQCATPAQAAALETIAPKMGKTAFAKTDLKLRVVANQVAFWERDGFTASLTECYRICPALGDRVVIIGGNDVPVGSLGFVVAIHPLSHRVELVMDKEVIGGTYLFGLLSVEYRGV